MNIHEINIGGQIIYLVIELLVFETQDENTKESYVCYYKFEKPTMIFYGELMREVSGKPIKFDSVKKAIDDAKVFFGKKIIFKYPLNYTKEELQKILNIPIRIEYSSGDMIKEIIGLIVSFSIAHKEPFLPYNLNILSITKFSNFTKTLSQSRN